MEAIFKSLKDGIITVDNEFKIIEANNAIKNICKFPSENFIGRNLNNIHTKCIQTCLSLLKETVKTQKTIKEFRIECRHSDHHQKVVIVTTSLLKSGHNGPLGAVLVVRDITRIADLERQLQGRNQFNRIIGKSSKKQ